MYPVCPITTTINLNLMNFSHRDTLWKVFSDYADDYEYTSDGNVIGSINNDLLRNDDPKAYLLTKSPRNTAARSYIDSLVAAYGNKAPEAFPFDIFELSWSLWNLFLAGADGSDLYSPIQN